MPIGQIPWNKGKTGVYSEKTLKLMSKMNMGRKAWNLGVPMSEESKKKLSLSLKGKVPWIKGRKHTKATRLKLSISGKGRKPWNKGKKLSADHIRKLSKSHIGIQSGSKHPMWNGGKTKTYLGYIAIRSQNNPMKNGYIYEHRLKMEKKLGRKLLSNEIVHHKNEIKHDNRLSNLEVMDRGEHIRKHNYRENIVKCLSCSFEFHKTKSQIRKTKYGRNFCTRECSSFYFNDLGHRYLSS